MFREGEDMLKRKFGMALFLSVVLSVMIFAGCESVSPPPYLPTHRVVREVTGVVNQVTGEATLYDIQTAGIMWLHPQTLLAGGGSLEGGDPYDKPKVDEYTKLRLWYGYPIERIPDGIDGKTVTLRYRVITIEDPPLIQIVEIIIIR